ncbi:hypothetical protein EMWEY_00051370, partial [Eimeria maxima]
HRGRRVFSAGVQAGLFFEVAPGLHAAAVNGRACARALLTLSGFLHLFVEYLRSAIRGTNALGASKKVFLNVASGSPLTCLFRLFSGSGRLFLYVRRTIAMCMMVEPVELQSGGSPP